MPLCRIPAPKAETPHTAGSPGNPDVALKLSRASVGGLASLLFLLLTALSALEAARLWGWGVSTGAAGEGHTGLYHLCNFSASQSWFTIQ